MRRTILLLCAVLVVPGPAHAQIEGSIEAVREHLRTRIEAERHGLDATGEALQAPASVHQFYEQSQYAPVWMDRTGPAPALDSLIATLQRASHQGLRPADYHVDSLQALRRDDREGRRWDPRRLSNLELLGTEAFLLYASHLLTGRVSPTAVTPTWNVQRPQADLFQLLDDAARTGAVAQTLRTLRPPQPEYVGLVDALRMYRRRAAHGGWPQVPDGPTLRMGERGPQIDSLRHRLHATGDLAAAPAAPDSFGTALHEAVLQFQRRHGLTADGAVGTATRAALNVPAAERVRQIRVNLERWRWLPQDLGRRYVLVNIAGFQLRAVDDGAEVLRMRVITGQPYRQTPVFSGDISYLVFNPYWHVPYSIATEDKLPEIQEDPGYLARQGFTVFRGWGTNAQPVDPATVPWDSLSPDRFPYRLRQNPGPLNALGRVKFMFPNPHSVYLHDTPTRGLFARAERDFSSGCVRVEQPAALAEFLLADQPEWSPERIRTTMETGNAERAVFLKTPVPVHLQYWTAWADEDGTVHFRNDVYQRDDAVYRALTKEGDT